MTGHRAIGLDRRRFLQAAAAAGLSAPLATGRAWAQGKEPLKIGVTMPLTGSQAGYGNDFVIGMRQSLKDINDAGGVGGRPLELVVIDTQAEPALGINAMNRLINVDKVPVILTAWSAVVKAAGADRQPREGPVAQSSAPTRRRSRTSAITSTRRSRSPTSMSRRSPNTPTRSSASARPAVLYINNDTGIDAAKIYQDVFEKAGGQVVAYEAYDPKATDFTGMLLKVRAAEPGHGSHSRPARRHADGDRADAPARPAAAHLQLFRRLQSEADRAAGQRRRKASSSPRWRRARADNPNVRGFLERWKKEQNRIPNGLPYIQYLYDSRSCRRAPLQAYSREEQGCRPGETMRDALLAVKTFDLPMTGKTVIEDHTRQEAGVPADVKNGQFMPLATLGLDAEPDRSRRSADR